LALSATQIGDVNEAIDALVHLPAGGGPGLGSVEIVVARAMVELQQGQAEEGHARLHAVVAGEGADSGFALAALAFAAAACGRRDEVADLVARVETMPTSTYLDRMVAKLGHELVRAASGEEDSVAGFTELVATIDETEDQVAKAIVRMAEALALDSLGLPTGEWALEEAERRLDELEIDASGWRTAFRSVLAADKAPAGA
jgi:hypothetical protein